MWNEQWTFCRRHENTIQEFRYAMRVLAKLCNLWQLINFKENNLNLVTKGFTNSRYYSLFDIFIITIARSQIFKSNCLGFFFLWTSFISFPTHSLISLNDNGQRHCLSRFPTFYLVLVFPSQTEIHIAILHI